METDISRRRAAVVMEMMMTKKLKKTWEETWGGSAYPHPVLRDKSGDGYYDADRGMTLRDWFAGQWVAAGHHSNLSDKEAADQAYSFADAMLAARQGGEA